MKYAEWLAAHMQTWGSLPSPGEAWEFAERQALERAMTALMESDTQCEAHDAIRALMQDAQSGEEKHDD